MGRDGPRFQYSFHLLELGKRGCGRLECVLVLMDLRSTNNLRNGPPLVGRLEKLTEKVTPVPLAVATAETRPLMLPRGSAGLKNSVVGSIA